MWRVDDDKLYTPRKVKTKMSYTIKHMLIMRMSATLTPSSRIVGLESSTNKTLKKYNFRIRNSKKTYFGALESPFNC